MANKIKTIIPTNLLKIREELGYTQKELGSILNVSERMICNYETEEANLPIEKAILISQKWNYSLDWIYCNSNEKYPGNANYSPKENPKFKVDIRDFFKISENQVTFSIPNSFWKYMLEANTIEKSTSSTQEKTRALAKLNGSYQYIQNTSEVWECSIDKQVFTSIIRFGSSSYIYAGNDDSFDLPDISEKQIQEVSDFLDSIASGKSFNQ